jgi:hypothetical protein
MKRDLFFDLHGALPSMSNVKFGLDLGAIVTWRT